MASLQSFFLLNPPTSITNPTPPFFQNPHRIHSFKPSISVKKPFLSFKSLALTESDSPKSLESPDPRSLLQDLVDSFNLPADYLKQLPHDLRLDLNDAAFDLSNGQVIDECGQELGETLLNITRAWEAADTSTSATLISKLPLLVVSVTDSNKSALGKRLVSSGRRFQSMGQYGQGELQKIAKAMSTTGKILSASPVSNAINEELTQETRMFKFGDLQVELTPDKAYIGAAIAFGFGFLSWELSQGVQSIQESSLQYANDNALLLAKSLRGALLAIFYSSTVLSAFATVGLVLLGGQLKSNRDIIPPPQRESFNDVYIAYELMDTDLHQIIRSNQSLSEEHCQYFLYQILRGLKYIHSANVLHRDLKPSNLLLNANCDLKICDFGLARVTSETDFMTEYVVTRWYRAPELLLNSSDYTAAIDVWSVGCIFMELMDRKPLFPGRDHVHQLRLLMELIGTPSEAEFGFLNENAKRYIRQLPPYRRQSLTEKFPHVHHSAIDLIEKMLTFDPRQRITVEDALAHPYLTSLHDISDEPICMTPFSFDFEQYALTEEQMRELIYREALAFNPEYQQM